MEEWLLMLILVPSGHQGYGASVRVATEAECISIGERWKAEMTVIGNPDSTWNSYVKSAGKYRCFRLTGKVSKRDLVRGR